MDLRALVLISGVVGLVMACRSLAEESRNAPLDHLDPSAIPRNQRPDLQPKELVAVLGSQRSRAAGRIALHPNDDLLAAAGFRGFGSCVVGLWDATTLERIAVLRGHDRYVRDVAFSSDGRLLASAGSDKTVRLWSINQNAGWSFRHRATLEGHEVPVHAVAFSPDGEILASSDVSGQVRLWDLTGVPPALKSTLAPLVQHKHDTQLAVAFSPDGTTLATSYFWDITLWDLRTRPPTRRRTLEPKRGSLARDPNDYPSVVESLAFSPDGKTLAAGHYNSGGVRLWDLTGDLTHESAWLDAHTTRTVVFSPDGKTLLSGGTALGHVWDVERRSLRARFTGRWGMAFSGDGKTMFSTHSDGIIRRWDMAGSEPQEVRPLEPHGEVRQVLISSDGRMLATGSSGKTVRIWDLGERQPRPRVTFSITANRPIGAMAFVPNRDTLLVAHSDGPELWDVGDAHPQLVKRFSSNALKESSRDFPDAIWSLAVLPDGSTVLTGGRYPPRLRIWDLTQPSPIEPIGVLHEFAFTMAYSSDGRVLATTHADRPTVRLWDMTNARAPRQRHEIENATRAAFSVDGKTLATGGNGVVQLWDLAGGKPRQRSELRADKGAVHSIDFSRQGNIVIGYQRGYVLLTDGTTRKQRDWQFDHAANVCFTPDGRHLLTQNRNATAYVLRLSEDGSE